MQGKDQQQTKHPLSGRKRQKAARWNVLKSRDNFRRTY
jgi:hypothetical protein